MYRTCVALCALLVVPLVAQAQDGRLKPMEYSVEVTSQVQMNYLLYLPPEYDQQDSWPLLVFLHGAGERGNDLEVVKKHGPPKMIAEGEDFPFIVVAPQCQPATRWNADAVALLTDHIAGKYNVDKQRMYLTGLSMGGYGTWSTVAKHPKLFAAIAPICGGGNPDQVEAHKHLPTWVFHGAKDEVVPLERSQQMVDALKQVGGNVRFTVYPDADHDSWSTTYTNPEIYEWLLEQKRP